MVQVWVRRVCLETGRAGRCQSVSVSSAAAAAGRQLLRDFVNLSVNPNSVLPALHHTLLTENAAVRLGKIQQQQQQPACIPCAVWWCACPAAEG